MNIIQTSTKMKEVLKEVLKEADYKKMLPIIEYISENDSITTKKAEELIGKSYVTAYRYKSARSTECFTGRG